METIWAMGDAATHEPLWVLTLRMGVAAILGALIGLEREIKDHPAGLRTHMLTALAAAAFTVMTFEIYHKMARMADDTLARLDPIRVIEAVTAGVAFLAAGAIIRSGRDIKGLTTGAAMWAAGAIGVAAGAGFFGVAVVATAIVLIITALLGVVEKRVLKRNR